MLRTDEVAVSLLQLADSPAGEVAHEPFTPGLGEEPHGADRQIIVRLFERVAPGIGECEDLGRTAPSALTVDPGLPSLDHAVTEQGVQVPAHGCGREPEPRSQRRGRGRPVLEN
jgi:hypothetical protein